VGILLTFAPFIVFAVVNMVIGATGGLILGALVAVVLLVRDLITPGRTPKLIEVGTALLFTGLALYAILGASSLSVIGVRLCVDAGLLLIVLFSMAVGRPFTLQYAREQIAPEFWDKPAFIRTNYVITGVWALAFAIMVVAELALLYMPGLPRYSGVIAIILALIGAIKFTSWYPAHVRAKASR
jgi:hypothetical protein